MKCDMQRFFLKYLGDTNRIVVPCTSNDDYDGIMGSNFLEQKKASSIKYSEQDENLLMTRNLV